MLSDSPFCGLKNGIIKGQLSSQGHCAASCECPVTLQVYFPVLTLPPHVHANMQAESTVILFCSFSGIEGSHREQRRDARDRDDVKTLGQVMTNP